MSEIETRERIGRRLLQLGMLLFLLGLLTGLLVPALANPRMGLSSHLEGILNGLLLLVLGAIWHRVELGKRTQSLVFWLAAYGAVANWGTTLLAAAWGAGGAMMPLAAPGLEGTRAQEGLITFGLLSLTLCMLLVSALVLWGLVRRQA